jgi:hypothetical protein
MYSDKSSHIAKKIKDIESLKLLILSTTNELFQQMSGDHPAASEAVGETLSALIVTSYRLGISVGVLPKDIDRRGYALTRALKARGAGDVSQISERLK